MIGTSLLAIGIFSPIAAHALLPISLKVYVATDAPDDLKDILKAKVRTGTWQCAQLSGVFFRRGKDVSSIQKIREYYFYTQIIMLYSWCKKNISAI